MPLKSSLIGILGVAISCFYTTQENLSGCMNYDIGEMPWVEVSNGQGMELTLGDIDTDGNTELAFRRSSPSEDTYLHFDEGSITGFYSRNGQSQGIDLLAVDIGRNVDIALRGSLGEKTFTLYNGEFSLE